MPGIVCTVPVEKVVQKPSVARRVNEAGVIFDDYVRKWRKDGSKQLAPIPRCAESHTTGGVEYDEGVEAPCL